MTVASRVYFWVGGTTHDHQANIDVVQDCLGAVNAAIKAEADKKDAEKAAKEVVEEAAPESIDDAQAAASEEGKNE